MNRTVHFSIDDVEKVFDDLIENYRSYDSIFCCPLLKWLKSLHRRYGACFTLYGYENTQRHNISEMSTKYKAEFCSCSDWLKIGFHSPHPTFDPYITRDSFASSLTKFYCEVERFASNKVASHILRFHYFHSPKDLNTIEITRILGNDVTLLCVNDPNRLNYGKSYDVVLKLISGDLKDEKGVRYLMTDLLVESKCKLEDLIKCIPDKRNLVIFTHEWAILYESFRATISKSLHTDKGQPNYRVRRNMENLIKWLSKQKYEFVV